MATELLSNTVGTALIRYKPGTDKKLAEDVGNFICDINKWFDIFNSYVKDASVPTKCAYGVHLEQQKEHLERMLVTTSTMRAQGENKTEEFKKISKFQKLPAVSDNGFNMTESVAILRYLSRTTNLPESIYAKDAQKQFQVDEYLEWQHGNVRLYLSMYFHQKFLLPNRYKQPINPENVAIAKKRMIECIDGFENSWLTPGPFISGNEITAADLWAACEIEQPRMLGYDPRQNRTILPIWIEKVREHFNPTYDSAHAAVYKLEQLGKKK